MRQFVQDTFGHYADWSSVSIAVLTDINGMEFDRKRIRHNLAAELFTVCRSKEFLAEGQQKPQTIRRGLMLSNKATVLCQAQALSAEYDILSLGFLYH